MAFGSWQTLEIPLFWKLSGTTNFGKRYFMKKKKKYGIMPREHC